MKNKKLCKLSALVLAAAMVFAMIPVSALAGFSDWFTAWTDADELSAETQSTSSTDNYRIVMLDCGRKYFSVKNVKKLIDTLYQYGYNQLTLAFGNGGCRFLLDDMSLSFSGVNNMTSDTVKSNITAGNNSFNGDTRYWSESEMDTIIEYANAKNIEIVPLLNMPGHATAILYNTNYTSNGNLNVNDETSRNYGYALLSKYVKYFKEKGCQYFHFGADESGFSGTGMTAFLQGCADVITKEGMTPRMFNDPADSYNQNTIPEGVEITYWYQNSHKSASALSDSGYSLINTHGRWYYVIKAKNADNDGEIGTKYWRGTLHSAETDVELPVMKQTSWGWIDENTFYDNSNSKVSANLGTMFCIWCDASKDEYLTDSDVISENGNYGALYQLEELAEHYWPDDIKETVEEDAVTKEDKDTGISVTAPGLTGLDVSNAPTITKESISGAEDVRAYEITPKDATGNYSGDATLKIKVPDGWEASRVYTFEQDSDGKISNLTKANIVDGYAVLEVTHFSVYGLALMEATTSTATKNVTLQVGETKTFDIAEGEGAGNKITGDDAYIATADVKVTEAVSETTVSTTKATTVEAGASYILRVYNTSYALTSNVGKTDWKTQTLAFEAYTQAEDDNIWTLEASGDGYKLKSAAGYLNLGTGNNTAYVSTTGEVFTLTYTTTGWTVKNPSGEYINALGGLTDYYSAGGWTSDETRFDLYKVTTATEASTTLTITGVGEGKTSVTVGDTTYNITVTAPSVTESQTLTYGGSFTPAGTDITITEGSDIVSISDGKIVAGQTDGIATVTSAEKNASDYVTKKHTYNVAVSSVDWSKVDTFDVELWCTNTPIGLDENSNTENWNGLNISVTAGTATACTAATIKISAQDAYREDGVLLSNCVIPTGVSFDKDGNYQEGRAYCYYKGVALHNGDKQGHSNATSNKEDRSNQGTNFYKIRYWNDQWQYLAENTNEWTTVKTDDNFVAYYLQKFVPSDEVASMTIDWGGIAGTGGGEDSDPFSWGTAATGYMGIGSAVVYEDRSMSPASDEAIWNSTLQLRYIYGEGSNPGTVYVENTSDYEVTKITITRGYHADSSGNQITGLKTVWKRDEQVLWDKVQNDAGEYWYDETVIWESETGIYNAQGRICLDDTTWGDTWVTTTGNNEAFLILIYVKPIVKEDSLKLVYWDDSANMQINPNDLFINVKSGTTFLNIKQTSQVQAGDFTLDDNATIENSVGTDRTINKNITIIDGVAANYKSGIYEYVNAEISEDGKTLTLHYNIKKMDIAASYVVDFGLPLKIENVLALTTVEHQDTVSSLSITKKNEVMEQTGTFGTAKIEQADGQYNLTYTLNKPLTVAVKIPLFINIGSTQVETSINVIPASNVLYEENFLTSANGWEKVNATTTLGNQSAEAVGSETNAYGYDPAYASSTKENGYNGYYEAKNLTTSSMTEALTTTFTGTGFDLIGNCGSQTGRVMVILTSESTGKRYVSIVDTRYGSDENGETLNQVPLVHREVPQGTYTVSIYASGAAATTATTQSAVSTYSVNRISVASVDPFEQYLEENNITDVEYIVMNDVLNASAQSVSAISTYATASTVTRLEGTHVEIDAFRVYYNTTEAAANPNTDSYSEAERNVQYVNILDAVKGEITAWTEGEIPEDITITDENYEANGGPQNEIYLNPNQQVALVFNVEGVNEIQVSLRSVNGKSVKVSTANDGNEITSSTEMYYTLKKTDNDSVFTIVNSGQGILGIGNIKVKQTDNGEATILTASELDDEVISYSLRMALAVEPDQPVEEQPTTFVPETFNVSSRSVNVLGRKLVTVSVTTSNDVAYITVNGQKVNAWNNGLSWIYQPDTLRFTFTDLLKRGESKTYEIVAYNADGVASAVYTVLG